LLIADTFAPALISIFTASRCPCWAAICKGRIPYLKEKWTVRKLMFDKEFHQVGRLLD